MKYTLEKCEGHVCVKNNDGKELSSWKNELLGEFGGLDKIVAAAKKIYPNLEINITDEKPS